MKRLIAFLAIMLMFGSLSWAGVVKSWTTHAAPLDTVNALVGTGRTQDFTLTAVNFRVAGSAYTPIDSCVFALYYRASPDSVTWKELLHPGEKIVREFKNVRVTDIRVETFSESVYVLVLYQ